MKNINKDINKNIKLSANQIKIMTLVAGGKNELSVFQKSYNWIKALNVNSKFIRIIIYIARKFFDMPKITSIVMSAYQKASEFQGFINSGKMSSAESGAQLKSAIKSSGIQSGLSLSQSLVNFICELVVFALKVLVNRR